MSALRSHDALTEIATRIAAAAAARTPLRLVGGGSKDFYGNLSTGEPLAVGGHCGIVDYAPEELVLTARGGTPLAEIEALLAANGQMLAAEPPHFGAATLGGAVAAGLCGPRRVAAGSLRDAVLGVRLVDGRGEVLAFGGRVVKNVAGYDVSRLAAGSLGTLGWIAEVSLRLAPLPAAEATLCFACDQGEALRRLSAWAATSLPLSASFWHAERLYLRLSAGVEAVAAASRALGGEVLTPAAAQALWMSVREQRHAAFAGPVLWRLALPPATPPLLDATGRAWPVACEWHGGVRWLGGAAAQAVDGEALRRLVAAGGGHATLFRAPESLRCREGAFAPLAPALLALHRRLKKTFDPAVILNPGRLASEF